MKNSSRESLSPAKWKLIYLLVAINTLAVFFLLWLFPRLFS